MPVIESKLDLRDLTFVRNREAMAALVADLRAKVAIIEQAAATPHAHKHQGRGKLPPRASACASLLDPGSLVSRARTAWRCTTTPSPPPGSSPASAASPVASA
ncbi:MAG: hypothetical protein IPF60_10895 [Betaproteobacteria bacterium]|nr:hypothetical protein [Betaproteobacteria bacterium]